MTMSELFCRGCRRRLRGLTPSVVMQSSASGSQLGPLLLSAFIILFWTVQGSNSLHMAGLACPSIVFHHSSFETAMCVACEIDHPTHIHSPLYFAPVSLPGCAGAVNPCLSVHCMAVWLAAGCVRVAAAARSCKVNLATSG